MKFSEVLIVKFGSIQRFMILVITLLFIIFMAIIYLLTAYQAKHETDEIFDAQLAHSAFILFHLLGERVPSIDQTSVHLPIVYHSFDNRTETRSSSDDDHADTDYTEEYESFIYQNKLAYQVFNKHGKLLIKSNSSPEVAFSDKKTGYSNLQTAADNWRVYSLYSQDRDFWLYVAESETIRNELSKEISQKIVLPAMIVFPVFLLLLIAVIRSGLSPLQKLVTSINRREAYSLKTIHLDVIPEELTPVLNAINALIRRLDDAITREQRLTADTAHELRTPLSVVLIHAQNALNNSNEKERDAALLELDKGIKRVARLLEQLLTLSKISPETIPKSEIKFHQLCQNVAAEMAVKMMDKEQELILSCAPQDQDIHFLGSDFLLEILIRNLLDNASQYSPEKSRIVLTIKRSNNMMIFTVEDSGVGIAPELYSRLTERFYRQYQTQGKGAGLGLTLVNNIVEFHKGRLSFGKSPLGGLQVKISIPCVAEELS